MSLLGFFGNLGVTMATMGMVSPEDGPFNPDDGPLFRKRRRQSAPRVCLVPVITNAELEELKEFVDKAVKETIAVINQKAANKAIREENIRTLVKEAKDEAMKEEREYADRASVSHD